MFLDLFKKENFRITILAIIAVFVISILYPICREMSVRATEKAKQVENSIKETQIVNQKPVAQPAEEMAKDLPKFHFTKTLSLGDNDPEVKLLQEYLNENGFKIATTGPGSPGHETTLFGKGTKDALIKFQEAYSEILLKPNGLSHGTGTFGKATRDFINS